MAAVNPYLQVEGLRFAVGDKELFRDISFGIAEGQRIGLIARNGVGKTSLLNIIAGKEEPEAGTVVFRRDLRVAYLEQAPSFPKEMTVMEACLWHCSEEPRRIKEYLTKLHITDHDQPISHLSGGQLKRVALANVLCQEPDLLILDEPTNHLDLKMIEWLENYLSRSRITLLMVTHDRYFLDRVCSVILELEDQKLYTYRGNYAYYLEKRQERINVTNAELARASILYRRELEWMRSTPQARSHKARYREEAFEDLERKVRQRPTEQNVSLQLNSAYIGSKIFEAEYVSKTFPPREDDPSSTERVILKDFYYNFSRYEKMGIVGANGTGKSTFIKMLLGIVKPDSGRFVIGDTVRFGYFSQEDLLLPPSSPASGPVPGGLSAGSPAPSSSSALPFMATSPSSASLSSASPAPSPVSPSGSAPSASPSFPFGFPSSGPVPGGSAAGSPAFPSSSSALPFMATSPSGSASSASPSPAPSPVSPSRSAPSAFPSSGPVPCGSAAGSPSPSSSSMLPFYGNPSPSGPVSSTFPAIPSISPRARVIDAVRSIAEYVDLGGGRQLSAMQFLQHFLFTPLQQQNYIYKLSGGERRRLQLCMVLMQNPNFLILDEPTNDLDIATLNILEDYLATFRGCVIVISHDRYFMDKVVDHLLVFHGDGNIQDFPGNYSQFREYQRTSSPSSSRPIKPLKPLKPSPPSTPSSSPAGPVPGGSAVGSPSPHRRLTYKEKREMEALEAEIAALEAEKSVLEADLCSGTLSVAELTEKSRRLPRLAEELSDKEMRWLELSEIEG